MKLSRAVPIILAALLVLYAPKADASITAVGTYATTGDAWDVDIYSNYAFVSDSGTGIRVLDISTPSSPTLLATYAWTEAIRFERLANKLYVVGGSSLRILDVTTPSAPTLLGEYTDTAFSFGRIATNGSYAYVSGYTISGTQFQVKAINVANPALPSLTQTINVGGAADLTLAGDYLYVVSESNLWVINKGPMALAATYTNPSTAYFLGVRVSGNIAYITDTINGLHMVDVTALDAMAKYQGYSGGFGAGLVVSNGIVYLGRYFDGGVSVIDATTPTAVKLLGAASGTTNGLEIAVANNIAVVAGIGGVKIFDVSRPDSTAPVVSLKGDAVMTTTVGTAFTEEGVTASDNVDGDISANVVVTGTLDTDTVGKYTLSYVVTDAAGNASTALTRTVVVAPKLTIPPVTKGKLVVSVKNKNVTLRPFPGYSGAVKAGEATINKKGKTWHFFVPTDAAAKPEFVVYNDQGKIVGRKNLTSISSQGLRVRMAADPATLSVYIAIAPKGKGLRASLYRINPNGLTSLGTVKAATGKNKLVFEFLLAYQGTYALVTKVYGVADTPKVWRYGSDKKVFSRDAAYPSAFLDWSKTAVRMK